MGSSRSLNVHLPWTGVLAAVGSEVADESALPARTRCPLCSGTRLTIYEDTISGGGWHYCFDCGSVGDMIQLAERTWKTSTGAALRKLQDRGLNVPDEILAQTALDKYADDYTGKRARINQLAADASVYLRTQTSKGLNALREKFRLRTDMSESRWADGPGRMMGGYPFIEVEKVFCPGSVVGNKCQSAARCFKGGGWGDVVVVPYFDLPGRICGFLFVGRNGEKDDYVFRVVQQRPDKPPGRNGQPRAESEGGLACLWAANEPNAKLGGYAVAMADTMLALRLQVRHYAGARRPLPLMSYRDSAGVRTKAAWEALADKTPVIWGWRLSASMVVQAMTSGGHLAITELKDMSRLKVDHYIRDNEPLTLLKRIVDKSQPWEEFLVGWANSHDDGAIEALFASLDGYGIERERYMHLSRRITELAFRRNPTRKVALTPKEEVVERDGQWWLRNKKDRSEIKLLNAVVRIDGTSIGEYGGNEHTSYEGRVLIDGNECPFKIAASTAQNQALDVFQMAVTRIAPRKTLACPIGYRNRVFQAALMFRDLGVT